MNVPCSFERVSVLSALRSVSIFALLAACSSAPSSGLFDMPGGTGGSGLGSGGSISTGGSAVAGGAPTSAGGSTSTGGVTGNGGDVAIAGAGGASALGHGGALNETGGAPNGAGGAPIMGEGGAVTAGGAAGTGSAAAGGASDGGTGGSAGSAIGVGGSSGGVAGSESAGGASSGAANGGSASGGAASGGSAQGGTASGGSGQGGAASGGTGNGGSANGGSGGCSSGATEICDGVDNDCNSMIDEKACPSKCIGFVAAGQSFMACNTLVTQASAASTCEAQGMRLAWLNSATKVKAVLQSLVEIAKSPGMSFKELYFGATDAEQEGHWHWIGGDNFWLGAGDGMAVNGAYENWSKNRPNNYPPVPGENCAVTVVNYLSDGEPGQWNDVVCTELEGVLCERP